MIEWEIKVRRFLLKNKRKPIPFQRDCIKFSIKKDDATSKNKYNNGFFSFPIAWYFPKPGLFFHPLGRCPKGFDSCHRGNNNETCNHENYYGSIQKATNLIIFEDQDLDSDTVSHEWVCLDKHIPELKLGWGFGHFGISDCQIDMVAPSCDKVEERRKTWSIYPPLRPSIYDYSDYIVFLAENYGKVILEGYKQYLMKYGLGKQKSSNSEQPYIKPKKAKYLVEEIVINKKNYSKLFSSQKIRKLINATIFDPKKDQFNYLQQFNVDPEKIGKQLIDREKEIEKAKYIKIQDKIAERDYLKRKDAEYWEKLKDRYPDEGLRRFFVNHVFGGFK